MNISVTIGKNLRAYRKLRGYTQEKLAELSGVHRTTLGGIERGEKDPRSSTLKSLADALGIAVMQLTTEFDEEGSLVVNRSTAYLEDYYPDPYILLHKKGREKELEQSDEQPQIHYALIGWGDNILYDFEVKRVESDIAAQTLTNVEKYCPPNENPLEKFKKIYPKVKALYGIE